MISIFFDFFYKHGIRLFAPVPLEECEIQKPHLLERAGIPSGTAVIFAVPYFTKACLNAKRNVSAYAVVPDYHSYFAMLFKELIPLLQERFPDERFAGFSDHSPIAEINAAARGGLGVIGDNHLLLTQEYSSYVFLGEIITSAKLPCRLRQPGHCPSCGRCRRSCPAGACGICLSALTQKKGVLTEAEQQHLLRYGSAWGCDICQEVCPYTKTALESGSIFTPISYFSQYTIPYLTADALDGMSDYEFADRAYAWRGKHTIRRNLLLLENTKHTQENADRSDHDFRKGTECSD